MSDSSTTDTLSADEAFQQAWDVFTKQRLSLQQELHQRRKEFTISSAKDIALRAKYSSISKAIRRQQVMLENIQRRVKRALQLVERRREAATKPQIIIDIRQRVAWARRSTKIMSKLGYKLRKGREKVTADEQLLADYKGPLPEAEASLQRLIEEEVDCAQTMRMHEKESAALQEEISALERQAAAPIHEAERQLQEHTEAVLQWAAHNRARLAWFIQQDLSRRAEAIERFRKWHPQEDISDLVPKISPLAPTPPQQGRKRSKATETSAIRPNEAVARPWTFVLTTTTQSREYRLPEAPPAQLDDMQQHFKKMKILANPSLVLNALTRLSNLTPQQRISFDRVTYCQPHGWLIIHAGEFRVLCDVDDRERIIRFCVRPRRDAYT